MSATDILEVTKADLQISVTAYDTLLNNYVEEAVQAITREGITLSASSDGFSIEDGVLVARYAAYLFRSRDQQTGMPRSLRYLLNNRLFSQKVRVNG